MDSRAPLFRALRSALVLTGLACAACASQGRSSSSLSAEDQEAIFGRPPEITLTPGVWETTGTQCTPTIVTTDGAATRDLEFVFRYEGPGRVQVAKRATIAAGETTAVLKGHFEASSVEQAAQGTVHVLMVNEDGSRFPVAEWPVLLRPSIVSGLTVVATETTTDKERYFFGCLVGVEFEPLEPGLDASPAGHRQLEFDAYVERQGSFAPEVFIQRDVNADSYPNLPRTMAFDGTRKIVFVQVEKPKFPPQHRAYLKVRATVGGDTHTKSVPLPLR